MKGQKVYLERIVLKKAWHRKNGIQTEEKKLNFEISMPYNIIPKHMPAMIKLSLPQKDRVMIQLYDIQGRKVKTLVDRIFESGTHVLSFDVSRLHSGVYFLYARTGSLSTKVIRKFVVLK